VTPAAIGHFLFVPSINFEQVLAAQSVVPDINRLLDSQCWLQPASVAYLWGAGISVGAGQDFFHRAVFVQGPIAARPNFY